MVENTENVFKILDFKCQEESNNDFFLLKIVKFDHKLF